MSGLQWATSARRRVVSLAGCAQVAADHASRNPRLEGVIAMAPRWEWAQAFLLALEQLGLIRGSARAVGIGTRTAYDKRERDPEFAAVWDTALAPFLHGDRRYDRRPLAAFPAHQALAPFERESAPVPSPSQSSSGGWAARFTSGPTSSSATPTSAKRRPAGSAGGAMRSGPRGGSTSSSPTDPGSWPRACARVRPMGTGQTPGRCCGRRR